MTQTPSTGPSFTAHIDHLVIGTNDLASGTDWTESRLGAACDGGGAHPLMGTHNRLMRLAGGPYLEVITIDPDASSPGRPRWFTLDQEKTKSRFATGPGALCWVAAVSDIETAVRQCGYDCGQITTVTRGDLQWRLTIPDDGSLPAGGVLPSLIEWPEGMHPVASLAKTDIHLDTIHLTHPDPAYIEACLDRLGLASIATVTSGDIAVAFSMQTSGTSLYID
ncbi:MAG: hypothetical protein CMD33_08890 [Flavobacteriales bacterium]|nr:hypothetical protein [Flavobacteriales bacterium]